MRGNAGGRGTVKSTTSSATIRLIVIVMAIGVFCVALIQFSISHYMHQVESEKLSEHAKTKYESRIRHLGDKIKSFAYSGGALDEDRISELIDQKVEERLSAILGDKFANRYNKLEGKVNGYLNWNQDPFLGSNTPFPCNTISTLIDEGTKLYGKKQHRNNYDHKLCMDFFPPKDHECIIYDFGIRDMPQFGETLANPPFNCKVFAFDPSPITKKWYETSSVKDNPNYHWFPYGAGAVDGTIALQEYNWDQVSIIRFPMYTNHSACHGRACDYGIPQQTRFDLPVKKLSTIMKELGHDHIDIVKIDVEGSEFQLLESMIDDDTCLVVDQILVEWHHYDFDPRYGGGASPHINAIVTLLEKVCGLYQFKIKNSIGGWPSTSRRTKEMGFRMYYNLASFVRNKDGRPLKKGADAVCTKC